LGTRYGEFGATWSSKRSGGEEEDGEPLSIVAGNVDVTAAVAEDLVCHMHVDLVAQSYTKPHHVGEPRKRFR